MDFSAYDYIALSDQDDIWFPNKISHAIDCLKKTSSDGYSGNVIAYYKNGRNALIVKSQPQTDLDYLFESAGPGCTYVMTARLAGFVRRFLISDSKIEDEVIMHDWLIYALARSHGFKWYIDQTAFMLYRQHEANAVGANRGVMAIYRRLVLLKSGWYRNQVTAISRAVSQKETLLLKRIMGKAFFDRLYLAINCHKLRRNKRDAIALAILSIISFF